MAEVRLKNVRIAFTQDLWTPKEFKAGDGKPRRSATFLVEPGSENDKAIRTAINAAAKDKFGEKWEKTLAGIVGNSNKCCYMDGDLKEYEGFAGMMSLAGHRSAKQGPVGVFGNVIDPETGQVTVLTEQSGKPYGGSYVNAIVDIYAQIGENPGVRCTLVSVQFYRDGDAFSGARQPSANDFEPIEAGADADSLI